MSPSEQPALGAAKANRQPSVSQQTFGGCSGAVKTANNT